MNKMPGNTLADAIKSYDYPAITYDFVERRERRFSSMRELDKHLESLLHSVDIDRLKDGLSGILYWGFYRTRYKDYRVDEFRRKIDDDHLRRAAEAFRVLDGTGLKRLKELALPQFSKMAFVTKLRTFLDPERYCVLDSKIASLKPLANRLKRCATYIPVTAENERAYRWWVETCGCLASQLPMKARPVDVERGLFYLVDRGELETAAGYISSF